MKRWGALALAGLALVGVAGCGGDPFQAGDGTNGALVVGSADFTESELVMEIYAEALRRTGADVDTKPRIGARETYVNAVAQGELSVMPDYTGNLLQYVDENDPATESGQVYDALRRKLPPGLDVLDQAPAEDSDVLTVTRRTADSGIGTLEDLGPRCGEFVLGAPAEWKTRWEQRIAEVYGCTFAEIRNLEAGTVTVDALTGDTVQVANLFTTSSQIAANDLVPLRDTRDMFPAQHVVPLVGEGRLTPPQAEAIDRVSRALSTEDLTELNRRLEVDKANPTDLAKEFVAAVGA
ncbi:MULTISPECIES: ABC transporter substrate-binding protein [unclassified Saccharopolyspora]|uniref:ABC transporter substrate-binding protein n=1 Tax=unclassified Saccharopolyspora TaxID=2646250 RepID=UPI001CD5A5FD|nr:MULTISPECIES: ABC transporter substrate-binding protein [unclassified Saccharopolyspora]MCA1188450.1 ABC transporter substrate-binding protein [Saccharopolyspora sp. 6T]MCA1190774.1 ABC transporter substrate-binding protein [Saccharopolyspora sp. 6V]MCA1226926.1 ABC transporter substrate-binding protein [Saccharopolyspora sp. 6M]MCA1283345.1 ABC transporter substrate-binding protein [Saccharopolyspora sp. 7B]